MKLKNVNIPTLASEMERSMKEYNGDYCTVGAVLYEEDVKDLLRVFTIIGYNPVLIEFESGDYSEYDDEYIVEIDADRNLFCQKMVSEKNGEYLLSELGVSYIDECAVSENVIDHCSCDEMNIISFIPSSSCSECNCSECYNTDDYEDEFDSDFLDEFAKYLDKVDRGIKNDDKDSDKLDEMTGFTVTNNNTEGNYSSISFYADDKDLVREIARYYMATKK